MTIMTAVVAAPAFAAAPAASHTGVAASSSWATAFEEWKRLNAAAKAANARFDRAATAYESRAPKPIKDPAVYRHFPNHSERQILALIDLDQAWADFLDLERKFPHHYGARKEGFRAALDAIRHYRAADRRADERAGYSAAAEECDKAWDAETVAKSKLMRIPAPDRAAALLKLEELFGDAQLADEGDQIPPWSQDYTRQFFNDVRRFLAA